MAASPKLLQLELSITSFQQLLDAEQYLPGMCVFLKSNFKKNEIFACE